VLQPPETVRVLTGAGSAIALGPVWGYEVEQQLRLPPGDLTALRISLALFPTLSSAAIL
jgi:hypothetical protein